VLATGSGSVAHAHLLRQWSDDVILFAHDQRVTAEERATLEARGIAVIDGVVERLVVSDDRLHAVQLTDGRAVPRAALFIRPGCAGIPTGPPRRSAVTCSLKGSCGPTPMGAPACPAFGLPATPPIRGHR
jgi:hypothetical protein